MLQGFLFSAYGFSISAEATAITGQHLQEFREQLDSIRLSLAITGIVSSVTLIIGIVAASLSMNSLRTAWKVRNVVQRSSYPQLLGCEFLGMLGGLVPVLLLPIVFLFTWSFLVNTPVVRWIVGISTALTIVYLLGLWRGHKKHR